MPMTFLSGTFYSIAQLPEPFHAIAAVNPFFYLIDGIRFGFTGHADGSLATGALVLAGFVAVLAGWSGRWLSQRRPALMVRRSKVIVSERNPLR